MSDTSKSFSDKFETIIVFGIISLILFPVRLLFVSYVSDNWFASFGLIGIVSITLVILAKKEKMGKFGRLFVNVMKKWNTGKRQYFLYIPPILLLIVSVTIISFINAYESNINSENAYLNFLIIRFGTFDDQVFGWMLHFYTVFLVEVLEVLGSMLLYRITLAKMKNK